MSIKNGFSLFEFIVVLIIISTFAGTLLIFIHRAAIVARETALRFELNSLRLSLVLYRAIKGEYPEDLRIFVNTKYRPTGSDEVLFGKEFLSTVGRNKQGYLIDPFGNRFRYDSKRGLVNSKTKGYENW